MTDLKVEIDTVWHGISPEHKFGAVSVLHRDSKDAPCDVQTCTNVSHETSSSTAACVTHTPAEDDQSSTCSEIASTDGVTEAQEVHADPPPSSLTSDGLDEQT